MRQAFEEELNSLHIQFFQMGKLVNEAIQKSVRAFISHDRELAKEVIENDIRINAFQTDLEKNCFELIALQQPVTTDLRKIVTVMKACADLERMGDHAVSIAKSTIRVKGNKRNYAIEEEIANLSQKVMTMVQKILDAYVVFDADYAMAIAESDHAIDIDAKKVYQDSIDNMKSDPEFVLGGSDYMLVSTYLERIGDYVTNICEWILYLNTGKIIELNTHNKLD